MMLRQIMSLVILSIAIKYSGAKGYLKILSPILIQEGATLMNYIYFDTADTIVTDCALSFVNTNNETESVALTLVSEKVKISGEIKNDDIKKRIKPLFRKTCGFTMTDYAPKDPTLFTLSYSYNENGEKLNANKSFSVDIFDNTVKEKNKTVIVELGQRATVDCGNFASGLICMLINPSGVVFKHEKHCELHIEHVTMQDLGTWTCKTGLKNNMAANIDYMTLELFDDWKMLTWYNESNGYGNVGCHYLSGARPDWLPSIKTTWCQMIRPDGEVFTISEQAGATERYSTLGTNLTDLTCQLEFPLPIAANEKGSWKCFIADSGGFALVDIKNKNQTESTNKILLTTLRASAKIACNVDYSSEDCFLTAPNGTVYAGGNKTNFSAGYCSVTVKSINETDLGDWKCHFSQPMEAKDEIVIIQVMLYDDLKTLTANVEINEGNYLELMCKATSAIVNCAFQDPYDNTYHVSPKKNSTAYTKYKYVGKGLNYGECGIIISNVKEEDSGRWKCLTRLNSPDANLATKSLSKNMQVVVILNGLTVASTIGIVAGVGTVCLVFLGGCFILKWRRNKKKNNVTETNLEVPLNQIARIIEINEETSTAHI